MQKWEVKRHLESQAIWPWGTKQSRSRVLPRERTGHSKHPLPTTQEKTLHMDITRWSTPKSDWYILCSQRWRNSIQSAKPRRGTDCGSDHEFLITKFRLKLKKVGERVTGRKARGRQMKEIGCKCQTFFLSLKQQEETNYKCQIFSPFYTIKRWFLLKFCVATRTLGSTWT